MAKSPAWQRKEGKNPEGGLNAKGVASYRRANPGSKLKTAVTTKPLTSSKTANDPNSRINKSLRKWNC
jgi:hypothetical protein